MNNKFKNISLYIYVVAILFLNPLVMGQQPKAKIGLLLSDLTIERWHNDRDNFVAKSNELGYGALVCNAANNQETQNIQADSLLNLGVKILVVVPVDAYKSSVIVEKAHKNGAKVVAYDRLIMNCDLDAYVSYDNEMVGQTMALYVKIRVKEGNFAYIGGPKTDRNCYLIRDGIYQILNPSIKANRIKMICDTFANHWTQEASYNIIKELLLKGNIPDVVFAANDELAKGVIKCLSENGLTEKVLVTGQDADLEACRNIVNGKQVLTLFKPPRVLADRAVQISSGLLGDMPFLTISETFNGKINVPSLILNPVPVDKKNIKTSVVKEGYHSEADIYDSIK
jgi:D-xylose transport system substrate-binding protein